MILFFSFKSNVELIGRAKRDEEIARKMQEQEERRVSGRLPDQIGQDEALARRIEEYEKERMQRYRAMRRRQMDEADMNRSVSSVTVQEPARTEDTFAEDFTDFLSQLPEGLTEDETKIIQQLDDLQLAKLLQETENKRSGPKNKADRINFIRKRAVEMRDEQIARAVQQREIHRFNEQKQQQMSRPQQVPTNEARNRNSELIYNNDSYHHPPSGRESTGRRVTARPASVSLLPQRVEIPNNNAKIGTNVQPRHETTNLSTVNSGRNNGNDDYLTPDNLLPPAASQSSNIDEAVAYEMPDDEEADQNGIEIDHEDIAKARARRQQRMNQQSNERLGESFTQTK